MAQVSAGKPASAPEAQGNEDPSPAEPVTEALPTTEEATAAQETRKRTTTASVRRRETTTGAMAFVVAGVAVAGALVLKKLAFGGRRTKGRLARGALDGEGDDCGALVEPLDVEPAPCPSVPESPLKLTGRTFVDHAVLQVGRHIDLSTTAVTRSNLTIDRCQRHIAIIEKTCF